MRQGKWAHLIKYPSNQPSPPARADLLPPHDRQTYFLNQRYVRLVSSQREFYILSYISLVYIDSINVDSIVFSNIKCEVSEREKEAEIERGERERKTEREREKVCVFICLCIFLCTKCA